MNHKLNFLKIICTVVEEKKIFSATKSAVYYYAKGKNGWFMGTNAIFPPITISFSFFFVFGILTIFLYFPLLSPYLFPFQLRFH